MNIVADIKNSIGRDDKGNPIDEVVFSVVRDEEGRMLSLWVGLPKVVLGKLDLSSKDCLDCCSHFFWEDYCSEDINSWLSYVGSMVDSEAIELQEEVKKVRGQLNNTLRIQGKLREVL
ncbi:hypothetical protein VPBG_00005 [Vibrio phage helene 12B3]|uniref:hypothetical protein n=1 Tax=Vibrio phage helene 12B3 TaxID=573173 RepID=UPI0002C0F6C6|nr:hypothetical protein VPBG_00005 [Vibrio phage helene 12B3]AGG57778.1 hypothetical protein VPBG_00005 [Vibrio phage helene 12B3]